MSASLVPHPFVAAAPRRSGSSQLPDWSGVVDASFVDEATLAWHCDRPYFRPSFAEWPEADVWNRHWRSLQGTLRGRLFSSYRRAVRSRCVARFVEQYFPNEGVFAECGCGSGETSQRLKGARTFLAVDFAETALRQALSAAEYAGGVLADIRELPFRDESLDGIWNLGVMEHFEAAEQQRILLEFHRVLKPGGRILLWWPPRIALDRIVLLNSSRLFPKEIGRLNQREAAERVGSAGFDMVNVTLPWSDCFTEMLVAARKQPSPRSE